jgi:hypothetical protein
MKSCKNSVLDMLQELINSPITEFDPKYSLEKNLGINFCIRCHMTLHYQYPDLCAGGDGDAVKWIAKYYRQYIYPTVHRVAEQKAFI